MISDVLIAGGGTAGAAAARALALRGLSVTLIERRPLHEAGARWVNGVPAWAFEAAGLSQPEGDERVGEHEVFHMVAGFDGPKLRVPARGLLDVDMRRLGARLLKEAVAAGARVEGGLTLRGYREEADGVVAETDAGPRRGRFLIEARGLAAEGPRSDRRSLCAAAQEVRALRDEAAAARFVESRGAKVGEALCFTCVAGGFSVVNVRVELHPQPLVSLLTGSVPAEGAPSGRVLLDRFVAANPWIGPRLYGGARAIPLHAPRALLHEGRVLRLGDSAGQVFAVHGSGTAAGLIGGRMVADILAAGGDGLAWTRAWQQAHGGLFAAAAVFAMASRSFTTADLARLIGRGLMSPALATPGLLQRPMKPPPAALPGLALGALRAPELAARLAPTLLQMERLEWHHRRVPDEPAALTAWAAARHRLLGAAAPPLAG